LRLGIPVCLRRGGCQRENGGNSGTVNGLADQKNFGSIVPDPLPGRIGQASLLKVLTTEDRAGGAGGLGAKSIVTNDQSRALADFPLAQSAVKHDSDTSCLRGINGSGGASLIPTKIPQHNMDSEQIKLFHSGEGARNEYSAWSSEIIKNVDVPVIPKQKLLVQVGKGGEGGHAGKPNYLHSEDGVYLDGKRVNGNGIELNSEYLGHTGEAGSPGSDGFVLIEWEGPEL